MRYEDINIDIISYTIVYFCNPQEKYLQEEDHQEERQREREREEEQDQQV